MQQEEIYGAHECLNQVQELMWLWFGHTSNCQKNSFNFKT